MKRVWFTFKILEIFLAFCCLRYHTRGFLNISYIQDHYDYVAVFGGFSLMSMFGCLSISMNERIPPIREGALNLMAAVAFIALSINSMYHAEKDFHLMYLSIDIENFIEEEELEKTELTEQPHPFFKYSKAQSVAALCCGSVYLLHSILAFDLAMSSDVVTGVEDSDEEVHDWSDNEERLTFYVFSKLVHNWLDKFEWFSMLADE